MKSELLLLILLIGLVVFIPWIAWKIYLFKNFSRKMHINGFIDRDINICDYIGNDEFDPLLVLYNRKTKYGFYLGRKNDLDLFVYYLYWSSKYPGGNTGYMGFVSLELKKITPSFFLRKKIILEQDDQLIQYAEDIYIFYDKNNKEKFTCCEAEIQELYAIFPKICLRGHGKFITAYQLGKRFSFKEIQRILEKLYKIANCIGLNLESKPKSNYLQISALTR